MKVNVLWGNPVAIVIVSSVFSLLLIVFSITSLLNGQAFSSLLIRYTVFTTLLNGIAMWSFYISFRQGIKGMNGSNKSSKKHK